jgi:hypothetical protein
MPNRILDSLAAGLDELRLEYEAAVPTIRRVVAELQVLRRGLSEAATPSGIPKALPVVGTRSEDRRPQIAEIETQDSGISELLALQELLANVPDVSRVTVTGMKEGRARLLVELADGTGQPPPQEVEKQPTLVCAFCLRVLVEAGPAISHGLCDRCAQPFVRAGQHD